MPAPPHLMRLLLFLQPLSIAEVATALTVLAFVILWIVSSAGNLEKVLAWVTAGRRQREAEVNRRLDELEEANEQFLEKEAIKKGFEELESRYKLLAADVLNQHNVLHEYERERERLAGGFTAQIGQLQKDVRALEPMPARVDKLESKLDNLVTQITDLKQGQRDLKQELREDMKNNKNEVIDAIRNLKP